MEKFLKDRDLPEENMDKMRDDKIDKEVVLLMSRNELSIHVPKYGNRIALLAFLKSLDRNSERGHEKKRKLVENLLDDLSFRSKRRNGLGEHGARSLTQHGNRNAEKAQRRIEVGWLNFDKTKLGYKQVKAPKGGSFRHYTLDGSTMETILILAHRFL